MNHSSAINENDKNKLEFLIVASEKHQELSKEYLPRLLGNDETLTELDLQGKYLTDVSAASIAEALRKNSNLTRLNLTNNFLEYKGISLLADALRGNKSLTSLMVARNDLQAQAALELLDALQVNNTLTELDVEGNNKIPAELMGQLYDAAMLNAQTIELKRSLQLLRTYTLQPSIQLGEQIRVIDLSYDLHDPSAAKYAHLGDFSARVLAEALRRNKVVEVLKLCYNKIGNEGAFQLALMLEENYHLDEINLFGNMIGAMGAHSFIEVLQDKNNHLTKLNLRSNSIADNILIELEWAITLNRQPLNLKKFIFPLRENDPDLVSLVFDEHNSQRYYDDISARLLADALQRNNYLTSLDMPNNKITGLGVRFMADMLISNTCLKHLNLMNNQIGDGCKSLSQALRVNSTLSSLILAGNGITDDAALEFADMLQANSSLIELDLRNNNIQKAGAAFVRAFHGNTVLQDLFLEGNQISETLLREIQQGRLLNAEPKLLRQYLPLLHSSQEGLTQLNLSFDTKTCDFPLGDNAAIMLAAALRENYVLTWLNLADNEIGINGLRVLCEALDSNPYTLKHLNISRNRDLGEDAADLMCRTVQWHKSLTSLDMSYNYIGEDGARKFLQHLRKSTKLRYLNITGCRCSKPTIQEVEVLVKCNNQPPGVKQRVIEFFDGVYSASSVLDFSKYDNFENWDDAVVGGADSYNIIAEIIVRMLEENNSFETLKLSEVRLGDRACQLFANAFSKSCSFTAMDLSYNRITDEGVKELTSLVKSKYELLHINLEGNKYITPEALSQLRYYLQYNKQPKRLKQLLINIESNHHLFTTVDFSDAITDHLNDTSVEFLCDSLKRNTSVTSLNLSNNHIALTGCVHLTDMLTKNSFITSVTLNNNVLDGWQPAKCFAEMLEKNATLKLLSLRANELSDSSVKFFLDALRANDTLTKLDLRDNLISSRNLELITDAINLNSQSLLKQTLPSVQGNTITHLNLSNRGYDNKCAKSLSQALLANSSLQVLNLSNNKITNEGAIAIAEALQTHPGLLELNLSENKIETDGAKELLQALFSNTALQVLDLSCNRIAPVVIDTCTELLGKNDSLLKISLDGNDMIPEVMLERLSQSCINSQPLLKSALPMLEGDDASLQTLDFSKGQQNGSGTLYFTHDDVTCKLMANGLARNSHLTCLNLSEGKIGDLGISNLASALMMNRSIKTLLLQKCKATDKSASKLADVLLVNNVLQNINLYENVITNTGAEAFAKALESNHSCSLLNLEMNKVTPDVLEKIGFALTLNGQPLELKLSLLGITDNTADVLCFDGSLSKKKFDDISAQIIGSVLRKNTSVRILELQNNSITDLGASYIIEMLFTNSTLKSLNLENNKIIQAGSGFVDALKCNTSLLEINLHGNQGISKWNLERIDTLATLNNHVVELKRSIIRMMAKDHSQRQISINSYSQEEYNFRQFTEDTPTVPLKYMNDASAMLLSEYLKTDVSITTCDLAFNQIGDIGIGYIAEALKVNRESITSLEFSYNTIGDEGAIALCSALLSSSSVTYLNLNNNQLTDTSGAELCNLVRSNSNLKKVTATGNFISAIKISEINLVVRLNAKHKRLKAILLRVIDDDSALTFLNLDEYTIQGWFDSECTELVATALETNYNVKGLSMKYNDLYDNDTLHIIRILKSRPILSELDLSNNYIARCEQLSRALYSNSSLTKLSLAYNQIDASNCLEIAKMLRTNGVLREIDLSGNQFGEIGARHLCEAIKFNSCLKFISLSNNDISEKLLSEIHDAITVNYNLQSGSGD